jgi:Uma2 family endonuclease
MVHAQAPVSAGAQDRKTSVPEPDVRVLAGDKPDFAYRHPQGPEVALLVEVSDTTLRRDTLTKRDLYARSGVPEYRVLDLTGRREYKTDFKRCHPKGNELMLAVEVSHTTLEHDAWTKRDLYARAGVPEYWILDLTYPRLLVFSELNTEKGEYASLKGYTAEDSVTFASKTIPVSALLPKS